MSQRTFSGVPPGFPQVGLRTREGRGAAPGRGRDRSIDADTDAQVHDAVFFAVADLLNLEVDLLFFDTTSTDFETEDAAEFRRHGKSKDSRPDLPQIVIGLAVAREGIPVRWWCWPGNTNDNSVLRR